MDLNNINLLPFNNALADVERIVVIIGNEEDRRREEALNRCIKNMYNKYHRVYMNANPEKRRDIQRKYKETHIKTDEQKERDRIYARNYYLKKKEEKRNRILEDNIS